MGGGGVPNYCYTLWGKSEELVLYAVDCESM